MTVTNMDSPDCSNNDGAFASMSRKCSRMRANPATNGSLSGLSSDNRSIRCTVVDAVDVVVVFVVDVVDVVDGAVVAVVIAAVFVAAVVVVVAAVVAAAAGAVVVVVAGAV